MPLKIQNLQLLKAQNKMSMGELAQVEGLSIVLSMVPDPPPPPAYHPQSLTPFALVLISELSFTLKAPQQRLVMFEIPPFGPRVLSTLPQPCPCSPDIVPSSQSGLQRVAGPTLCAWTATFQILWSGHLWSRF